MGFACQGTMSSFERCLSFQMRYVFHITAACIYLTYQMHDFHT